MLSRNSNILQNQTTNSHKENHFIMIMLIIKFLTHCQTIFSFSVSFISNFMFQTFISVIHFTEYPSLAFSINQRYLQRLVRTDNKWSPFFHYISFRYKYHSHRDLLPFFLFSWHFNLIILFPPNLKLGYIHQAWLLLVLCSAYTSASSCRYDKTRACLHSKVN